jgi:hypothetical protein
MWHMSRQISPLTLLNWVGCFPDNLFRLRRGVYLLCIRKIYKKYETWQTNDNLRAGHFYLNCGCIIWIIGMSNNTWRWTVLRKWFEETKHWNLTQQRPQLFLQTLQDQQGSSQSLDQLLLFTVLSNQCLRHPNETTPLSQLLNRYCPVLRFRLKFLRFLGLFKGSLFKNFNEMIEYEILIMPVQKLENNLSIVFVNLKSCSYMLDSW